ncbi:MAG: DUF454 family protein [Aquificaceae bacterium]|nr:YbaN family protein [Aquificaceae bacterium]MCS7278191.1 YbaN family protein [Aquificaceae bacterium]MDW8067032.1 DUF454 family protein [Aquificaceae bacterium]MDW8423369.1 DUF454 family protein [Aquificaceae bacterium]
MKKNLYRISGFSFLVLGTLGAFLPVIPTVPFYLLAVLLLSRSSKKDIVKIKRLPLIGKRIYPYLKRSVKYLKRWTTRQPSFST